MKNMMLWAVLLGVVGVWAARGLGAESIESMPPVVVKTVPEAGRTDVMPGEVEIRVSFSKEMAEGSWSWCEPWKGANAVALEKPRYESDGKTCVLKVRLEAGKTYAYWLNTEKFQGFKDRGGRAAVPYLLVFQTKGASATSPAAATQATATQAAATGATAAAEAWLKLVDAAKYDESWQELAGFAQKAVKQADWAKSLDTFRTPLGKVAGRKLKSAEYFTTLPGAPDGEYVVLQFATEFEHKKAAVETITPMKEKDGKWRVSGYYVK